MDKADIEELVCPVTKRAFEQIGPYTPMLLPCRHSIAWCVMERVRASNMSNVRQGPLATRRFASLIAYALLTASASDWPLLLNQRETMCMTSLLSVAARDIRRWYLVVVDDVAVLP
jgi:hypothetical protein